MSKATIAKLTVLIFLAFIVCLPEFFPSVQQVLFLCAPFDPCVPNNGRGYYDDNAGIIQPRCGAPNAINEDEAVEHWFVCETHTNLQSLYDNATISEKDLEVIITLQIAVPPLLKNVTINGHVNHRGIYTESHHNIMLFSCCVQNKSTQQNNDKTSNTSRYSTPCIFPTEPSAGENRNNSNQMQLSNITNCLVCIKDIQGMSSKTVKWWCVSTIAWFILVLLVIILVFLGVRDQVYKNKHCCKKKVKPVQHPVKQLQTFSKRRVKSLGDLPNNISALSIEDIELFLVKTPDNSSIGHVPTQRRVSLSSTKGLLRVFQESYKRGLSPIPELSLTAEDSLEENEDEYNKEAWPDCITTVEGEHEVCLEISQTQGKTQANTHAEHATFLHHRLNLSLENCD